MISNELVSTIAQALTKVFNQQLKLSRMPNERKIEVIHYVFRCFVRSAPGNCRSASLSEKVLYRVVAN